MTYVLTDNMPIMTTGALLDFIADSIRNRDESATGFGWSYHDQRINAARRELARRGISRSAA